MDGIADVFAFKSWVGNRILENIFFTMTDLINLLTFTNQTKIIRSDEILPLLQKSAEVVGFPLYFILRPYTPM